MPYDPPLDGEIAAWAPLTARLLRKLRDSLAVLRMQSIKGFAFFGVSGNAGIGSWSTIGSIYLWVPGGYVAADGTSTIRLRPHLKVTAGPNDHSVTGRFQVGAVQSAAFGPVSTLAAGSDSEVLQDAVEFSVAATRDALLEIECQANGIIYAAPSTIRLDPTVCDNGMWATR